MKRIILAVCVLALVFAVAVSAQTTVRKVQAKAWTPEQQEVVDAFSGFFAAALRGNFEEIKAYWHPNIVGWDINQDSPMIHDDFLKGEEGFFKDYKFTKLEFEPLAVQVEGKTAIIHLNYDGVFIDRAGKETTMSGHWTTTMVKQDKKWVILSNVWKEK
jgi:ketosteroid isomerase-like protein